MRPQIDQFSVGKRGSGRKRRSPFMADQRLIQPLQTRKRDASIDMHLDIVGMQPDRAVETRNGFFAAQQYVPHIATIIPCLEIIGRQCQRMVIMAERLFETAQCRTNRPGDIVQNFAVGEPGQQSNGPVARLHKPPLSIQRNDSFQFMIGWRDDRRPRPRGKLRVNALVAEEARQDLG